MGQEVRNKFYFCLFLVFAYIPSYSQQPTLNNIQWKQKSEAAVELYEMMKQMASDTTPVFAGEEYNAFQRFYFKLFNKGKIDAHGTLRKQELQNEIQNILESNFVLVNGSIAGLEFKDKSQIIIWGENLTEWGRYNPLDHIPYTVLHQNYYHDTSDKYLILPMLTGSGIPYYTYYVFINNGITWELQATIVSLFESRGISIDNNLKKIIIETTSGRECELPLI